MTAVWWLLLLQGKNLFYSADQKADAPLCLYSLKNFLFIVCLHVLTAVNLFSFRQKNKCFLGITALCCDPHAKEQTN